MNRDRRTVALRLAFLACLVGFGWWLRPHEVPTAPSQSTKPTLPEQPPAQSLRVETIRSEAVPESPGPALATFRGRVVDAVTREPVREFELKFIAAQRTQAGNEDPGARKFRADDGRFEWQHLPPGQWSVTAKAPGYQHFNLVGLKLAEGEATADVVLPLRRGHTLRGRVYDGASQAGIASASIGFREAHTGRFDGGWRMRSPDSSRKDGSFVLNGVPPGRVTLEVSANDYASRELDVVVADDTAPLEIALSSGGLIAGRLTAADGVTPVEGFAGVFRIDRGFHGGGAPTSESGEFAFRNLTPGRYRVTGQAASGSTSREFEVADNERIEGVVLALGAGRSVRGTVTGLRPAELKALHITSQREGQTMSGLDGGSAQVNERGEYELRGVPPGRVHVVADVSMRRQLLRTVDVPADADVIVNFDFPRGVRLSGRVTQRGKPIARAWLSPQPTFNSKVFHYGTTTSAQGAYAIEDLAPGEYVVRVGDSYSSRPVQVSGDTVLDIDIPPAQLAGRVLEDDGKVPIVGAQVVVWSAETTGLQIRLQDGADHFGRFELAGLEPGDLILTAYKPGYEMFRDRISYTSPVSDMTIELRRDVGVELRAHDAASGKALAHVYALEMLGDHNGSQLQVQLDENGVGYLPRALAGATLAFSAGGYVSPTLSAWDGKRLDLKFVRKQSADEPAR